MIETAPVARPEPVLARAAGAPAAAPVPWGADPGRQDVWPSPAQELLLRAALIPDERALHAWRQVRSQIDVAALDGPSQALMPALRKNLLALGVEDELLGLFKGVHRYSWARNQMLLAPMIPMVQGLERAGIPTMLLKGAAFVADTRLDAGMRPMHDIDVLVPTASARSAIDVLIELGLAPVGEVPAWYVADYAPRFVPSHGFRDELDRQLDLHWHVLHASCQPDADEDFWAGSEPIELLGVPTRALCPTDELLLVVLHGLRWNALPTYRWVVDAALLCGGAIGSIDYERLLEQARKRRATATLAAGLEYLRRVVAAPIPSGCIRALSSPRPSRLERAEFRAQMTQPRERSALQWQVLYHQQQARRELPLDGAPTLGAHLRLARRRIGIERPGDLRHLRQLLTGGLPGPGRPASEVAAAVGGGAGSTSTVPVAPGEPLELGEAGVSSAYTAHGTWLPEAAGCWIAGRQARLMLPLAEPAPGSLLLEISADGFLAPGRSRQRLGVSVNGVRSATLAIDPDAPVRAESVVLPRRALAGRRSLDLLFEAPDAVSAARLGVEDDDRRVGVFLRRLLVREPGHYELGTALTLGEGSGDERVLAGGWGAAEPEGRWTVAPLAQLLLRLDEPARGPVQLEFDGIPFLERSGRPLEVDVLIDGRRVSSVSYRGSAPAPSVTSVTLAAGTVGEHREVLLGWRIRDPRTPHSLGISKDRRPLGLFVRRVALNRRAGAPGTA